MDLMDQYISGAYLERTSDTVDTGKCGNPADIAQNTKPCYFT